MLQERLFIRNFIIFFLVQPYIFWEKQMECEEIYFILCSAFLE